MIRAVMEEATKRFFGQIWDDFLGYFKVYDYIKLKTNKAFGVPQKVPSVASFWYSILGDKFGGEKDVKYLTLRNGDVLTLKDVFLTEWAPKLPGKAWTVEGFEEIVAAQEHLHDWLEVDDRLYSVMPPRDKRRIVSSGYGSLRIARQERDEDHYMYMSLVSADQWHCDMGIPVVVSKPVYNLFYKYAESGAPRLKSVEGVLHIGEDLPFEILVPKAIGSLISKQAESTLRYRAGLPRCYLHVTSPMSVKPTVHDKHPAATAWTQFKARDRLEPYKFTYSMFDPSSSESTDAAIAFINEYVRAYRGERIITDFDGQQPRLEASIPIKTSPLTTKKSREKVAYLVSGYNDWIISTI